LKEWRELTEERGKLGKKGERVRGSREKCAFFFLPPDPEQRRGRGGLGRRRASAPQGSTAAGGRGKPESASRGIDSPTHLELLRTRSVPVVGG
jgi:hypothetical protein